MKQGNFVGGGWLPMEKEELEQMLAHFKKQLTDFFGKGFFKRFYYKYEPNPIGGNEGVIHAIFYADFAKPFNGRNKFNSTIKDATCLWFFVTKDKGKYLEIKDEKHPYDISRYKKDYKNCPPFSYGCSMHMTGKERRYRKQHWESIQNWKPYTYGTEISDLTYSESDLEGVRKAITPRDFSDYVCVTNLRV